MTDVDQFEGQAKYVRRYLTKEQRVSEWVRGQTGQLRLRVGRKPHHITKSLPARTSSDSSTKDAEFAISTTIARQQHTRYLDSESQIISPTLALISSALLVCVILPSLLTVSAFVVLLTYASSLEARQRRVRFVLTILPLIQYFFYILTVGLKKRKRH